MKKIIIKTSISNDDKENNNIETSNNSKLINSIPGLNEILSDFSIVENDSINYEEIANKYLYDVAGEYDPMKIHHASLFRIVERAERKKEEGKEKKSEDYVDPPLLKHISNAAFKESFALYDI